MKIMPLGDTLTSGGTANPGGYRTRLLSLSTAANLQVDYVGTLNNGALSDTSHEGHNGQRIDEIRASIDSYLSSAPTDAVLLHIGTYDITQGYQLNNISTRLQDLVVRICTQRPGVKVVVAKIVDIPAFTADVQTYNNVIPTVVANCVGLGYDVRLVDLSTAVEVGEYESDGIVPTLPGFEGMADAWFPAVQTLFFNNPTPSLDPALWFVYSGVGTDNQGTNDPSNVGITDGNLELRGLGDKGSGIAMKGGQTYGAWEIRALVPAAKGYAPYFSLWPDSENMTEGYLQFLDTKNGLADAVSQALYRINNPTVSNFRANVGISVGVFHIYRIEWTPTRVTYFVDGQKTLEVKSGDAEPNGAGTGANYIPTTPHHLTMQLNVGVSAKNDGSPPTLGIPVRDGSTPQPYKVLIDYVRVYNYTGSSSSGTVSPENAPIDEVSIGSGATLNYDTTRAKYGTKSAKVATGSTAAMSYMRYTTSVGTQNMIYGRGYWYFTSRPPAHRLAQISNTAGICADIFMTATGQIQLRQYDGLTVIQSAEVIPLNQWVRIEWRVHLSASGTAELQIFYDADATSPSFRGAVAGNFRDAGTDYRMGILSAVANAGPYWLDAMGWSNENWLGPPSANDPPVVLLPASAKNTYGKNAGLSVAAYDPDGSPITYSWQLISAPAGASAFNAQQTLPNVSYLPTKVGSHVFSVTVTDASGKSTTSQVTLEVKPFAWQQKSDGTKVPLKRKVLKGTPIGTSAGWGSTPWCTGPWGG